MSAELLNPSLAPEEVDHKWAILDLHVRFEDGREADVEMQQTSHAALVEEEAWETLEELSADPRARELARSRRLAWATYRLTMDAAELKGFEQGVQQERKNAVLALCEVLEIPVD